MLMNCIFYSIVAILILKIFSVSTENSLDSLDRRCLPGPALYSRNIYLDHPTKNNEDKIPFNITIGTGPFLTNFFVAMVTKILISDLLYFSGVQVKLVKNSTFNLNLPRENEVKIVTEYWMYPPLAPELHQSKIMGTLGFYGRFGFYTLERIIREKNITNNVLGCSKEEIEEKKNYFNNSYAFQVAKEALAKTSCNVSFIQPFPLNPHSSSFHSNPPSSRPNCIAGDLGYHISPSCLYNITSCLVILTSYYHGYGKCLTELVKSLDWNVAIFWVKHQVLVSKVMESDEPVLYFGWNTEKIAASGKLVPLEILHHLCLKGQSPLSQCTFGSFNVYKLIHNSLVKKSEEIPKLVEKIKINLDELIEITKKIEVKNYSVIERSSFDLACDWLKKKSDTISKWLNGINIPEKEPINILIVLSSLNNSHHITMKMAIEYINNLTEVLPNYTLSPFFMVKSSRSQSKINSFLLNEIVDKNIKASFAPLSESDKTILLASEDHKLILFNYMHAEFDHSHSPVHYFSITPEFNERVKAVICFLKKLNLLRVSLVSSLMPFSNNIYTSTHKAFVENHITIISDVRFKKSVDLESIDKLDDIIQKRSNVIIILDTVICLPKYVELFKKKGITQDKGYVFIFMSGLSLLSNETMERSENKDCQCNSSFKQILRLLNHMVTFEDEIMTLEDKDEVFGKNFSEWKEEFKKRVRLERPKWNETNFKGVFHTYSFDSLYTFAYTIDQITRLDPVNINKKSNFGLLRNFTNVLNNISFDGMSKHVSFSDSERIAGVAIKQLILIENANGIQGYDLEKVGAFDQNKSQCLPYPSKIKWTKGFPVDVREEECNLQFMMNLFHVSCNTSVVLLNIFIVIIFVFLMFFIVYKIKKNYDKNSGLIPKSLKDEWEISTENIVLSKELGAGEFGKVFIGLIRKNESWIEIAIKMLKENASNQETESFFNEALRLTELNHPNIIKFIGTRTESLPFLVLMELMLCGDLRTFLSNKVNCMGNPPMEALEINPFVLTRMVADIGNGLEYLFSMGIIHRDLACRNCLVHKSKVIKIGDFGMAEKLHYDTYMRVTMRGKFPLRWMAPESLNQGIFSFSTDIWSFGVLIYEIITMGGVPYASLTNDELIGFIKGGGTLEVPEGSYSALTNLLKKVWSFDPQNRPNIDFILEEIKSNPTLIQPFPDLSCPQEPLEETGGVVFDFSSTNQIKKKEKLQDKIFFPFSQFHLFKRSLSLQENKPCSPNKSPDVCTPQISCDLVQGGCLGDHNGDCQNPNEKKALLCNGSYTPISHNPNPHHLATNPLHRVTNLNTRPSNPYTQTNLQTIAKAPPNAKPFLPSVQFKGSIEHVTFDLPKS